MMMMMDDLRKGYQGIDTKVPLEPIIPNFV